MRILQTARNRNTYRVYCSRIGTRVAEVCVSICDCESLLGSRLNHSSIRVQNHSTVTMVPLKLKFSPGYYACPCGTMCIPRYLEILIHKFFPKTCYLTLSDFELNIFAASRNAHGALLDRVFVRSVNICSNRRTWDMKFKRNFTIDVYKEMPSKSFAIYCSARSDYELREWQRAFLIFQLRESRQADDIIDCYLALP